MKKIFLLLTLIFLSGCGSTDLPESTQPTTTTSPKPVIEVPTTTTVNTEPTPETIHPVSIPALINKQHNGSDLKLVRILEENSVYTRHYITYKSGELTISGIMNIPKGEGPFPVLILNHGHIDTNIYTNGRGLRREQDYFARHGFAVLHTDYRNHAESNKDTRDELAVRLSYAEDAINSVYALKNAKLPNLDTEKIGMLGHSMGGGVTLGALVIDPALVDAAVLYAPVSGDMRKSYERWMSRRPEAAESIAKLYGTPTSSPEFWDNVSSETFYDRITAPIAIFHGTADESVPLEWLEETKKLLEEKGKQVSLTIYPDAPHEFVKDWQNFMDSSRIFFEQNLK